MALHTTVNLETVCNCPDSLKEKLKKLSRLDMGKEVLYHPTLDGGEGLPILQLKFFKLKFINLFSSEMSDQNSLLPTDFFKQNKPETC